jgi:3',5'-cyclic AMP phosphodiesterase CpdA
MRTIVHLSDLHFGRVDDRIVTPLIQRVRALNPDLVAISGDFTQRARRGQFIQAKAFLDGLPFPKLMVPGNHDVPLYNVATRLLNPFGGYRRYIAEDLEPVFVDDEMALVGLNSARALVTEGRGRLNEMQVKLAADRLRRLSPQLVKIVVTHHPFDLPEGFHEQNLVGRAAMAMEQLADGGADLFLAGHLHVSHVGHTAERYKIKGHSALIVQAGTMSTRGRGELNTFNVLRLTRPEVSIERYTWDAVNHAFASSWEGKFRHAASGWSSIEPGRRPA